MLKIKDNVDLKELEKFGCEYEYDMYKNMKWFNDGRDTNRYRNYVFGDGKYTNQIWINEVDRIIHNVNCDEMCNDYDEEFLDKLFNIIQAGLVEKVSD